jgi:putative transposase
MIEPDHPRLSIQRQCTLVSISRSAFYYQPAGETPLNLTLMRLIDAPPDPGLAPDRANPEHKLAA